MFAFLNNSKNLIIAALFIFITSCNVENIGNNTLGESSYANESSTLTVSANYAGSLFGATTTSVAILSANVTTSGCKVGNSTYTYGFGSANTLGISTGLAAGVSTAFTGTSSNFVATHNDLSCTITVNSITLSSSNGYANGTTTGSGSIYTYNFTAATASGSGTFSSAIRSVNNPTNTPSYIYAAIRFNLANNPGTVFSPTLNIYYGQNINILSGILDSNASSIYLSGTTNGGIAVPAPTYCIASGYGQTCETTNLNNLSISYDATSYVVSETLNLYPTPSFGATTSVTAYGNAITGQQQTAEFYKIIGLGNTAANSNGRNTPLVSNGIFYATNTTNGGILNAGSYFSASPPSGSNCGNISNFNDNSGCTYSVIDSLWNNSQNYTNSTSPGVSGIAYTFAYGSFNSAVSPTNTYLSLVFNVTSTGGFMTNNIFNGAQTPCTTCYPASTYTSLDIFGYAVGSMNSSPGFCPSGGAFAYTSFCLVPLSSAQASVRYLILRHVDSDSNIPSYQLIVFKAGY